MPSVSKLLFILAAAITLAACESPKTYPISGEECGPEDPVQSLDASIADCMPNI